MTRNNKRSRRSKSHNTCSDIATDRVHNRVYNMMQSTISMMQIMQLMQNINVMHTLHAECDKKTIMPCKITQKKVDLAEKYVPPCRRTYKMDMDNPPFLFDNCERNAEKIENIIPIMIFDKINNKVDKIEPPDDDFAEIKLPDNEKSIRKNIDIVNYPCDFVEVPLENIDDIIKKGTDFIEILRKSDTSCCDKYRGLSDRPIIIDPDSANVSKHNHITDDMLISTYNYSKDANGMCIFDGKKYSINVKKIMKLVKPLKILRSMIGMQDVKNDIYRFIAYFLQNDEISSMLNTAIYGKPGVGKTDLGKILCMIYCALEIVPSQRFRLVKASELIGKYVGETRQKTREILNSINGGVLFIDEVYSLMSGTGDKLSYGKECIDTLNQELSENRNKLVVIIAGYEQEIENTFFKANEGLNRRFPFRYTLNDYTADEMKAILLRMVRIDNVQLSSDIDDNYIVSLFRDNQYFENCGGDIENLLTNCKFASNVRSLGKHPELINVLTKHDFEQGLLMFKKQKKMTDQSYQTMFI